MKTALLRPVLLLIGLNVIIKPLWIVGIDRQVQLLEGPEVYGRFFALFQLSLMFHVILDAGIQTFLSQQKGKNTALSSDFIYRLGITKIILSFIYFGLSMALAFVLGLLYKPDWMTKLLVIQILHSAILFCRTYFAAELRYSLDRLFSILDKALSLGIMGVALLVIRDINAIDTMLNAQLIGLGISVVLALSFLYTRQRQLDKTSPSTPITYYSLFQHALPFTLMVLFMTLYQRADGVMIAMLHKEASFQNGLYAMSFRLYDALNVVPFLATSLLLPTLAKRGVKSIEGLLISREILRFATTLSAVIFPLIFWAYDDLFSLFYGNQVDVAEEVFEVMMICFMVGAPLAVLGTILTAADKVWTVCLVALSGCILNIVCNALFIPSYGALGASWTTLATALFITLLYLWHLRTIIGQILSWKISIQYIALGTMCWASFALINQFLPVEFLFKVILYLIITSAIIASTKWLQISILPTTRN
tara:strand:- start:340 stop:1773 length:1434 start_codon:yes stop_codon:yes gene_type:complete